MTDEEANIELDDLICPCFVFPHDSIPDLDLWLSLSPYHFHIEWKFPALEVYSWNDKTLLRLNSCDICFREKKGQIEHIEEFLAATRHNPLRALDLFAGAGALGLGIEQGSGGCCEVTNAIEISPSAAQTLQ